MIREYKESDLDTRPHKELPQIVVLALALILVLSLVGCFTMAVLVLK